MRHPDQWPNTGPIPATVWVAGGSPRDLDAGWPVPVVASIVTSFTDPGSHVVLLPWPTPGPITPDILDRDSTRHHREEPDREEPDRELPDALTTVRGLDRTAQVIRIKPEPALRTGGCSIPAPDRFGGAATGADLVITSLRPDHSGGWASDQVAWAAARLLRTGGVLAVLTHSDTSQGQLVDPTGAVVAAAQNADLLYLQHIVVVHAPVRDGEFVIEPQTASPDHHLRPGAPRRGQPATHHRIHADLLVFAQPRDHNPPWDTPAASARQAGPLR